MHGDRKGQQEHCQAQLQVWQQRSHQYEILKREVICSLVPERTILDEFRHMLALQ